MDNTVGDFLYYLFIILCFSIFCCTFCGNFWKAHKNITVFEKDSQQLFQIILQYFNLFRPSHAMNVNTYLRTLCNKNKNIFYSSKDRLHTKIQSQFSKIQDKKPFVVPFLSPKNFDLTSLKLQSEHCQSVRATVCVNGFVIFPEK